MGMTGNTFGKILLKDTHGLVQSAGSRSSNPGFFHFSAYLVNHNKKSDCLHFLIYLSNAG